MRNVSSDERSLINGKDLKCCFQPFLFTIKVRIKIDEIIPYERIVWSAKKKGLSAKHEFFFQEHEKGVMVTSIETFTGLLAKASGFILPIKRMRTLTKTFLNDLKRASED